MSTRIYTTEHPEHGDVAVISGWDPEERKYYLLVQLLDSKDPPLYDSQNRKTTPSGIIQRLKSMDLSPPASLQEDLEDDALNQRDGYYQHYGNIKPLKKRRRTSPSPLAAR
ncbi:hypothetical protein [Deinococcus cellulosilyticus]|uniref:Uncharacterized protein n=1 Tax=Deinococcus cellulosilyticus (strain DSM 18568 / NBRC 106333 / KACC 11606 / 5516J-15) TaxID=1223518 RepID=A0A511NAF5_DEIC1|nr:hypothetical protein [Deinococcus cellulosilyticus]GEM49478.1 hypothetical protein DC3_51130 [Deinococcus cellulosilyticus NBRC 106333 = KACC 11606]